MSLQNELLKYGLSQKESHVYVGLLELGSATVQQIAQKSGVNRATTYLILDGLKDKGLVSIYEKEKRTFYSAENPNTLVNLLKSQELELKQKREELSDILPDLLGVFNLAQDKPVVRYYEGASGMESMRQEFYRTDERMVRMLFPYEFFYLSDDKQRKIVEDFFVEKVERQGFKYNFLFCVKDEHKAAYENEKDNFFELIDYCSLSYGQYPVSSDTSMLGDKIIFYRDTGTKKGEVESAVMISDELIAINFAAVFDMAWSLCKKSGN